MNELRRNYLSRLADAFLQGRKIHWEAATHAERAEASDLIANKLWRGEVKIQRSWPVAKKSPAPEAIKGSKRSARGKSSAITE